MVAVCYHVYFTSEAWSKAAQKASPTFWPFWDWNNAETRVALRLNTTDVLSIFWDRDVFSHFLSLWLNCILATSIFWNILISMDSIATLFFQKCLVQNWHVDFCCGSRIYWSLCTHYLGATMKTLNLLHSELLHHTKSDSWSSRKFKQTLAKQGQNPLVITKHQWISL